MNCPTPAELQRLLRGDLPQPQAEGIERHLDECDRCAETVTLLGVDDTLAEAVRAGASLAREAENAMNDDVRERVAGIPSRPLAPQETVDDATADTPSKVDRSSPPGELVCDFLEPAQGPDEIGRLGGYRVLRVLGHGGMGVVFLAEDTKLDRRVALKAMLPEIARRPEARKRFLREARTAAAIEHDNLVPIYQVVDEENQVPFLAMPFLQGASLEDWLRPREKKAGPTMKPAQILKLGREIARGLAAAHGRGLIHRDIKPANIWLDANAGGRARILDFGLAKPREQDQHLTKSGAILGTPTYMAPEQARGEKVDGRADLWSLGVVLYRLCCGRLPFRGIDTMSMLLAVATLEPPPVSEFNPDLPPGLADLVMSLLAKDPNQRPETAQEVVQKIAAIEKEHMAHASGILSLPPQSVATIEQPAPFPTPKPAQATTATVLTTVDVPPRKPRRAILLGLAGAACAAIVFYLQTPHGTLRIEIDDPNIQVKVDAKGAFIQGADKHDIRLTPGTHLLNVKRGDLEFETDSFVLRKGDTVTLRVEWIAGGKLRVVQGEKVLGERVKTPKQNETPNDLPLHGLEFTENGSHVQVPNFPYDSNKPLTVEALVYQKQPGYSAFVGLRGGEREFVLWTSNREKKVGFAVHDKRNSFDITMNAVYATPVHLAAIWDGSKTARFFVNGVPAVTVQPSDFFAPDRKGTWLTIGGNQSNNPKKQDPLNAVITQVRISQTARYQKPFAPLRTFDADKDTIALYKFDEGSGAILKDSSGNGHDGKIVGAKWVRIDEIPRTLPAGWVDLLPFLDFEKDQPLDGKGTFARNSDGIEFSGGKEGHVWQVPVSVSGDYEIEMAFTPPAGKFALGPQLVVGNGRSNLMMTPETVGLHNRGKFGSAKVEPGKRHTLKVQVASAGDKGSVAVVLDGKSAGKWEGSTVDMTVEPNHRPKFPLPNALGLYAYQDPKGPARRWTLHGFKLRMITGEARVVRELADLDRRAAEWALSISGTVKVNESEVFLDSVQKLPSSFFRLTEVSLPKNNSVTDEGLKNLAGCRHLTTINLHDNSQLTDRGFAHLNECDSLTSILARRTKITDKTLELFKNNGNIKVLGLDSTGITDDGLRHFKDHADITDLALANTKTTRKGWGFFRNCKNIRNLVLTNLPLHDDDLTLFANCDKLEVADLQGTRITNSALSTLKKFARLRIICLQSTPVTNTGLIELLGLNRLELLYLQKTQVDQDGIDKVHHALPRCRIEWDGRVIEPTIAEDVDRRAARLLNPYAELTLRFKNGSGAKVNPGKPLPEQPFEVTSVFIPFTPGVPKDFVGKILLPAIESVRHVHTIRAAEAQVRLTDKELSRLSTLPTANNLTNLFVTFDLNEENVRTLQNLAKLKFLGTEITGNNLKDFKLLGSLAKLEWLTWVAYNSVLTKEIAEEIAGWNATALTVIGPKQVEAGALAAFAKNPRMDALEFYSASLNDGHIAELASMTRLVRLKLMRNRLTDASLQHFAGLINLEELLLQGNPVTEDALKKLAATLPRCRIVHDGGVFEPKRSPTAPMK